MKIYLDDLRPAPEGWVRFCSVEDLLAKHPLPWTEVQEISFDHDLGLGMTGYDLASMIEQVAHTGKMGPVAWRVHSANPVGSRRIRDAMVSAEKAWAEKT